MSIIHCFGEILAAILYCLSGTKKNKMSQKMIQLFITAVAIH